MLCIPARTNFVPITAVATVASSTLLLLVITMVASSSSTSSAANAAMATVSSLPPSNRMVLSKSLAASLPALYTDTKLAALLTFGTDPITGAAAVTEQKEPWTTLKEVVGAAATGGTPSVCFVVRRPG
jgi:hypothetical protein